MDDNILTSDASAPKSESSWPTEKFLGESATTLSYGVAAGTLLILLFLKAFRQPSMWGASSALFSYEQGFVKRGFYGELLRICMGDARYSYVVLSSLAFLILGSFLGILLYLGLRRRDVGFLVFLCSPGAIFLLHLVGYLDIVNYFLALAVCLVTARPQLSERNFWIEGALATAVSVLMLLIHEASFFLTIPLVFFQLCQREAARFKDKARDQAKGRWVLVAFAVVVSMSVAFVGIAGKVSIQKADLLYQTAIKKSDFKVRRDGFYVLQRTLSDNRKLSERFGWFGAKSQAFLETLPLTFVFSAFFGWRFWCATRFRFDRLANAVRKRFILRLIGYAAMFSPLSLNFLGWDTERWSGLVVVNAFLLAFMACEQVRSEQSLSLSRAAISLTVLIMLGGIVSPLPLGDEYTTRLPPYAGALNDIFRIPRD